MYFKTINTLDELKSAWRKLALANHPDAGGDTEVMKAINIEYEALFNAIKNRHNFMHPKNPITENAYETYGRFYTQNGWIGKNYNINLTTTEIAKIVRQYIKEQYPNWKFSVTRSYFSGGNSIQLSVIEAPYEIFQREKIAREADLEKQRYDECPAYNYGMWRYRQRQIEKDIIAIQMHSVSDINSEWLTHKACVVIQDVYDFMQLYNFSDCDARIDYFNVNFYSSLNIGNYKKGFKVVPKPDKRGSIESMIPA